MSNIAKHDIRREKVVVLETPESVEAPELYVPSPRREWLKIKIQKKEEKECQ